MSGAAPVGVTAAEVALVSDGDYYTTVRALIDRSTESVHASLFIVDTNAHHDAEARVLQVLKSLQDAAWRGVDTKLLIGGSADTLAINEASHIAAHVARDLGVDCRLLNTQGRRGSHVKIVTADDYVLSGSHNWSRGAFSGQTQDSTLVRSAALAAWMRAAFAAQWARAAQELHDVQV